MTPEAIASHQSIRKWLPGAQHLKILMIAPSFHQRGCGIAAYTANLIGALEELGHSVSVVCDHGASTSIGPIPTIPLFTKHRLMEMLSIPKVISDLKPDVVHIQYQFLLYSQRPWILLLPAIIRVRHRKVAVVVTMHDMLVARILPKARPLRQLLMRYFISCAHAVIVTTPQGLHEAARLGTSRLRVQSIPVGSNVHWREVPEVELQAVARLYGVRRDHHVFTALGVVSTTQHWDLWLQAIAAMDLSLRKRSQFLIVGGSPVWKTSGEPDFHEALRCRADALGIGPDVLVTGYVQEPDLAVILHLTDTIVRHAPNGTSSGSTTTAAAITFGIPIIAVGDQRMGGPLIPSAAASWSEPQPEAIARAMEAAVMAGSRRGLPANSDAALPFSWRVIASAHHDQYMRLM